MANLKETSTWELGIYQIEENDPVHGGENGITNRPAKQLANRTKWLNDNKVQKNTTITAGNGLTGGGDLSANRSLALGTPSQITATSSNSVTAESHSHAIDKASTTVEGIVQLNDSLTSTSNTQALTANQGKILDDKKLDKTTVFTVEGNNKVYRYHDVSMFAKRSDNITGVIAIKLPVYFTTMYTMLLQGFNYAVSSSWSAEISAYQYTATSAIASSAHIHGNAPFNKIQFASKNGSQYILLGETSTIWRYPAIHIKEVLTHFNNQQHWATGYEFSVETDLSSFQILATPPLYGTPRALSAEKLVTPRQLSISGDATATANFDGSANANLALTLANTGVTAGNYQSVTVDNKGRVTAGLNIVNGLVTATTATGTANQATNNDNTYLNLVTRIGTTNSSAGSSTKITGQNGVTVSSDTNGNLLIGGDLVNHINNNDANRPASAWLTNYLYVNKLDRTANAVSASKLQTARTINGVAFDGSQNISIVDDTKLPLVGGVLTGELELPNQLKFTRNTQSRIWSSNAVGFFSYTRNGDAQKILTGGVLVSNAYDDESKIPNNGLYAKGNIQTAGQFIGNLDGNANTASRLQTPRTINGVAFDGTRNITIIDDTKVEKAQKSAGTDARTLKQDGIYSLGSGGINLPTTSGAYKILSLAGNNPAWVHQLAIKAYSTEIWLTSQQSADSEEWLAWKRLDGADWGDIRGIPTASLTQAGITRLNSAVNSNLETQSATPKAVKTAYDKAIDVEQQLNQLRSALQIQRKDYSARLTPTHNNFRTQTINVTGSVEVLPDGRIIQRFTFTCPVIYFHRHNLSAFYREKLGVSSFAAEDSPLLELPLWTAMPNKVQEARIHLSSNLNHNAWGEALEFAYDWDSIFNQHVNIKDKAYFCFNRVKGSQDEPVTFNIVVEGY